MGVAAQSAPGTRGPVSTRIPERYWTCLGWGLWGAITIAVVVYSIVKPGEHTVSPTYWEASRQWWASQEMYGRRDESPEALHGFLYLPQAAILATPFAYLPLIVAECLWRVCNIGTLAWAMWRLAPTISLHARGRYFAVASGIAMPVIALSAQNGQFNIVVLGVMILGVVEAVQGRAWRGAFWLALAVAIKPPAIVLALLMGALEPRLRWRGLAALAAFGTLPWFRLDWPYVWQEHRSFAEKLDVASRPLHRFYQDIGGLLWTLDILPPKNSWPVIRLSGAIVTLAICWFARRRLCRQDWMLHTLALALLYILLFNPRTESPTYAMLAPVVGVFGALAFLGRRYVLGTLAALSSLATALNYELTAPHERWLQPSIALAWFFVLGGMILRPAPERPEALPQTGNGPAPGGARSVQPP